MKTRSIFILISGLLFTSMIYSQVPKTITHQGFLTKPSGTPYDTTLSMTFKLYQDSTGGAALWTQSLGSVQVSRGVYNAILSPSGVAFDKQYWLEVQAGVQTLSPRRRLTSSPYALRADTANNVGRLLSLNVHGGSYGADFHVWDFPAGSGPLAGTQLMAGFTGGTGLGPQVRFSGAGSGFIDVGQDAAGNFVVEGTDAPRLTVMTSGYVGIGTTSPQQKFVVSNSGAEGLEVYTNQPTGTIGLQVYNRSTASYNTLRLDASQYQIMTGKVGIGTTSPSTADSRLHVAGGNIAVEGTTYRGIVWVNGNTYQAHMHRWGASNSALYVTNAGTSNLTGVYLASGGTSWTSTSDRRLKENIGDATYGLDAVLRIPVREFNFKDSQEKRKKKKIGFVAQEIYPIIPEIVQKGDDGEYSGPASASAVPSSFVPWGVDYTGLTPILVKSIQEQQRMIETLSKQLDDERGRNQGLESRLRALEKRLDARR